MKIRKLLIRAGAVLVLVAIAVVMMIIGRGHTVYIDNKTLEYNGTEYKALYKVEVRNIKGQEKPIKLMAKDRGAAKCIGQSFHMDLVVTEQKDGEAKSYSVDLSLPYGVDGPIVNIPALLAGLPEEAWLDEFIPAPVVEEDEDVNIGDEFGIELEGDGESAEPQL